MLTTFFISIIVLLFAIYFLKFIHVRPHENFPPGPPRLPIWGSWWIILALNYYYPAKALRWLSKFYKRRVLGLYLGSVPTVIVHGYDEIKEMLYKTEFDGRSDILLSRLRFFNKRLGIFFSDGDIWHVQRRFALRHMRDFGFGRRCTSLEGVIANDVKEMIELCKTRPTYPGEEDLVKGNLVLVPDIFTCIFTNAMMAVMTRQVLQRDQNYKLRTLYRGGVLFQRSGDDLGGAICQTPWVKNFMPTFFGYSGLVKGNQPFSEHFTTIIRECMESYDDDSRRHFLDLYIKRMNYEKKEYGMTSFNEEQLLAICVDFTFPATTATTMVLGMLIEHILLNPEIQRKIHEEIDTVVGKDRLPTLDDRRNMPYTEACLREAMRYETIVMMGLPHRAVVDTTFRGYTIPENTVIAANMWDMHMDVQIWGDPETFRPERFLNEDGSLNLKSDLSFPFSAGKRLCAGETFARQSMFQVFAGFIQQFQISMDDDHPFNKLSFRIPGLITTIKEFYVKITPRT